MEMGSGFPVDLIIFGLIAAFLVLRLRSILGRRTGFERQAPPVQPGPSRQSKGPVIEGRAEPPPAPAPASRGIPDPASKAGEALLQMRQLDRAFDPTRFLDGADQAFRIIVAAFASGDRVALRPLLSDDTYRAFEQAIAERERSGETQVAEIRAIQSLGIEEATLNGRVGSITVRIVSDQVSYTKDKDNRPLTGTDGVTEIIDLWRFERDLSQQDPTWRLVAARSG
jgi:predicted lipid-binding transport protein (Tim44 family)